MHTTTHTTKSAQEHIAVLELVEFKQVRYIESIHFETNHQTLLDIQRISKAFDFISTKSATVVFAGEKVFLCS